MIQWMISLVIFLMNLLINFYFNINGKYFQKEKTLIRLTIWYYLILKPKNYIYKKFIDVQLLGL